VPCPATASRTITDGSHVLHIKSSTNKCDNSHVPAHLDSNSSFLALTSVNCLPAWK
jgi:hypothetical protein